MKKSARQIPFALFSLFFLLHPFPSAAQSTPTEEEYYSQEIRYHGADASEVFLVWGINGWEATDEAHWSGHTFLNDGQLYTPLVEISDTFVAHINIPEGARVDLVFLITKNSEGHFVDVWDANGKKGYNFHAMNKGPLSFSASSTEANAERLKTQVALFSHGWKLLLFSAMLFLSGLVFLKIVKWPFSELSFHQKIIYVAFCMYVFLFIARVEVLGLAFRSLAFKHLSAGAHDLFYVGILTILFVSLGLLIKNLRLKKWLFYTFLCVSVFSLLIALININVVNHLGKPFNYRWLYYSDFLGSKEAKNAVSANASWATILNITAICISFLILSFTFIGAMRALQNLKPVNKASLGFLAVFVVLTMSLPSLARQNDVQEGKLENPVTSFIHSFFSTQNRSTLFSMKVPEEKQYFKNQIFLSGNESVKIDNVILIVMESVGARYLDLYGGSYDITPALNKYSDSAVIFENVYAHAPNSVKSLISILCSMYPWVSFKALTKERPDFNQPSLADLFTERGLRTSFFTSSDFRYHGSMEFIKKRPFDVIENYDDIDCPLKFQSESLLIDYHSGLDDICLVQRFSEWLGENPGKPFFSLLWTNQTHYPYFFNSEEKDYQVNNIYLNRYLNTINHTDEVIGNIIETLKAQDLFRSTLIAVVGDHGEAFGQHGEYGHGGNIYEESMQIPFILINPELFHGERISKVGGTVDIAPTIASVINQPSPESWQGVNLLRTDRDDRVFFFATWSSYLFGGRIGNKKIIFDETDARVELYDLELDPFEKKNIAPDHPELTGEYREQIAGWLQYQKLFIDNLLAKSEKDAK